MTDRESPFVLVRDVKSRAARTEEEHRQLWRDIPDEFVPPWEGEDQQK